MHKTPYALAIGGIHLPTALHDVSLAIAEPGLRELKITVPVYGDAGELDPREVANRMRRQLDALLANRRARDAGLFLRFPADPSLEGWIICEGGDLAYSDGGPTLGEYTLELANARRIATPTTHREARRLLSADRRLASTPRDFLGRLYSIDFAAQNALAMHFLPVEVSDALGTGRTVLNLMGRRAMIGRIGALIARPADDVASFERPTGKIGVGGVHVYDRRRRPAMTPPRVNQVPNPSLGLNATGWAISGSSGFASRALVRDPGWAYRGTHSLRATWAQPADAVSRNVYVASGTGVNGFRLPRDRDGKVKRFTLSAYVNVIDPLAVNAGDLECRFYKADGTIAGGTAGGKNIVCGELPGTTRAGDEFAGGMQFAGGDAVTNTVGVRRWFITGDPPADAAYMGVRIYIGATTTAGDTLDAYIDAILGEAGELGAYFDGDDFGYRWTGTAHASTSEGPFAELLNLAPTPTPIASVGVGAWKPSGTTLPVLSVSSDVVYGDDDDSLKVVTAGATNHEGAYFDASGWQPLKTYTAAFRVYSERLEANLFLTGQDGTDTSNSASVVIPPDEWTELVYTYTLHPGATLLRFSCVTDPAAQARTLYFARVRVVEGTVAGEDLDGDDVGLSWLDARGNSPTVHWIDEQDGYGWEEVYGPDQPLTGGDVPTLENGLTQTRWIDSRAALAIDAYEPLQGAYIEQGRLAVHLEATAGTFTKLDTLLSANVVERTPERAVVRFVLTGSTLTGSAFVRFEVFVTLQRGWSAPRVEVYGSRRDGVIPGVAMTYSPAGAASDVHWALAGSAFSGTASLIQSDLGVAWNGAVVPTIDAASEPWIMLSRFDGARPPLTIALLQASLKVTTIDETQAYGDTRKGLRIAAELATPRAGYLSATLGFGSSRAALVEAETYRNAASATATQVGEAATGGGQTINETQLTAAADTVTFTAAQLNALGIGVGRFGVYARIRKGTGGGAPDAFIDVRISGEATATSAAIAATTFVWVKIAEGLRDALTDSMTLRAYRNDAAALRLDRLAFVPLERRVADADTYDGVRDLAQTNLIESQQEPALCPR